MNGHGRVVCSCGALISQCRCLDHTEIRVVQDGCPACAARKIGIKDRYPRPGKSLLDDLQRVTPGLNEASNRLAYSIGTRDGAAVTLGHVQRLLVNKSCTCCRDVRELEQRTLGWPVDADADERPERCPSMGGGDDTVGSLRCGLEKGHPGDHSALRPTGRSYRGEP